MVTERASSVVEESGIWPRHLLAGWVIFRTGSWLPDSVFSSGRGRSSVDAWNTTALDIEECFESDEDDHVHIFVADVVKTFDTVDRNILDCVLSGRGLPGLFRHVHFEFHSQVRLRFKLAAGEAWTRDGGIPQGSLLSMVFIAE